MPVIRGKIKWGSVNHLNTQYEPCYTIDVIVTPQKAKELKGEGINVRKDDDGDLVIRIKRSEYKANGEKARVPLLMDSKKRPIDVALGNGSDCSVQYKVYDWNNKFGSGKGLDLMAVMVHELVEYGAQDGEELEEDSDGYVADDAPDMSEFDGEPPAPPTSGEEDVPF